MPLGDRAEGCHVAARQQPDRQPLLLAGGPEPGERAVGPPGLLVRLVEGKAEAEHARPLPPILDDVEPVRRRQIEIPEDAELVGMRFDRFDRQRVHRLAERAGRMEHRGIDPGLCHLLQRIFFRIGRDLPVMRRHLGVLPDVDLRIDDQHRTFSSVAPETMLCTVIPAKADRVGRKSAAYSANATRSSLAKLGALAPSLGRRIWRNTLRFSALQGLAGSRARIPDEDRRDPRGRRALDPFAAAALGIALAAARWGLAGSRIAVPGVRRALAAQFVDAGADRLEIVGGSRTVHRTSLVRWAIPARVRS